MDAVSCGAPASPCRTFQFAHDATPAGGEIRAIDPGDYGPLVISKSISVVGAAAGTAGVFAIPPGGAGIRINAGSATVFLKGLVISDAGQSSAYGVQVDSAGAVTITDCVLRTANFSILFASTNPLSFTISNTRVFGSSLRIEPPAGVSATGSISNVVIDALGGANAIEITPMGGVSGSGATVSISNTKIFHAGNVGVLVQPSGAPAIVSVRDVFAASNGPAAMPGGGFVASGQGAVLRIAHSVSTGGAYGVASHNGALVESYLDNNLRGNVTGEVGNTGFPAGSFVIVPNR